MDSPPPPVDTNGFATTADLIAAMNQAMSGTAIKAEAVPTTGPGLNKCKFTWVPSNLVQSGGVTGTAGKCSRIVQCGNSANYWVHLFDIGDGC